MAARARAPATADLLTTGELLAQAGSGISLRAFHHWVSKGAIIPAEQGDGSGHWHRWLPEDALRLRRIGRWSRASSGSLRQDMVARLWAADPELSLNVLAEGCLIYLPPEA